MYSEESESDDREESGGEVGVQKKELDSGNKKLRDWEKWAQAGGMN